MNTPSSSPSPRRNSLAAWWLAIRPKTLSGALIPIVIGCGDAVARTHTLRPLPALLCALFALLMQVDANFINDLYDYLRGTDREDRLGPARACASGWISARAMRRGIVVCSVAACCVGLPLVYYGGWSMIAVGAACLLGAYLYTGGRYPLAYHGWGDVLVLGYFGVLPVGLTSWLQDGVWSGTTTLCGVCCGLVIDTLLMVNNYRDRDGDRSSGKQTVVVRFGASFGRQAYLWLGVLATLGMVLSGLSHGRPAALLSLLYLGPHIRTWLLLVQIDHGRELNRVLGRTSMNMLLYGVLAALGLMLPVGTVSAQSRLYRDHFDLTEVTLSPGSPYYAAQERGVQSLLAYDADRLLTPYVRQAGLAATSDSLSPYYRWEERHPNFVNWCWNPSFALDGHVGGHYLTGLSLAYAAERDSTLRRQLGERIDHFLQVLGDCQAAYAADTTGLRGYLGGLPDNTIWTELYRGRTEQYARRGGWVPFYCIHKIIAGLRDAWLYAGRTEALSLYRGTCDWAVRVTAQLSDEQMEREVLSREPGGMNEVLADAYGIFGDTLYLHAARRFSHQQMVRGMQEVVENSTFLDHRHANTQVPKYVGFGRIDQWAHDTLYERAARHFWEDVAGRRTVCIGGNSVGEHFLSADRAQRYISHPEGPETCNTNNMLKLTEELFERRHEARYTDFYEHALLNHLLSTQDPATGGYVYFTSLRPESYRIYSQVNTAMWCCVGTGMENHVKYSHFIYTHADGRHHRRESDTLFVQLYIASELHNERYALRQETSFPYEPQTRLTIGRDGRFTLALRHPAWATEGYRVCVNGHEVTWAPETLTPGKASYVYLARRWRKGDVVEVSLPMALRYEECPGLPDYVAFFYGPVLLGAATTSATPGAPDYEALPGEYADDSRMGHSPSAYGRFPNLLHAPMLLGDREALLQRITPLNIDSLRFEIRADSAAGSKPCRLTLQPFYTLHHVRYMAYWLRQTPEEWAVNPLVQQAEEEARLEQMTVDVVMPGEQQSEAGHAMSSEGNTWCGVHQGERYRTVSGKEGWFEYRLKRGDVLRLKMAGTDAGRRLRLEVRAVDAEGKTSDDVSPMEVRVPAEAHNTADGFTTVEVALPTMAGDAPTEVALRFLPDAASGFPGVYQLRMVRQ